MTKVSSPVLPGRLKHRWSVANNHLVGITAGAWWRLLKDNRFAVDMAYWHRAALITVLSALHSLEARREERQWGEAIDAVRLESPPVFVLGHWRSGTTHLHNILSRDPQFAFPDLVETFSSHCMLSDGDRRRQRWASRLPATRPMDAMAVAVDLPQEDEFAVALSSLRSPYHAFSFPRRSRHYERYISMRDAPPEEIVEWKRAFVRFLKKLTLRHRKPLVLKSPAHTARIRLLLELFPGARFVHVHRNPYEVFQSFRHDFDSHGWYLYLQKPDVQAIEETILRMYNHVFDAFFADRPLIPRGQYHEVAFADLERRPLEVVEETYRALGLEGFEAARPALQAYLEPLSGYRRNRFRELPPEWRERIATSWRRTFDEWGYPV
jgi:hypothetical protein